MNKYRVRSLNGYIQQSFYKDRPNLEVGTVYESYGVDDFNKISKILYNKNLTTKNILTPSTFYHIKARLQEDIYLSRKLDQHKSKKKSRYYTVYDYIVTIYGRRPIYNPEYFTEESVIVFLLKPIGTEDTISKKWLIALNSPRPKKNKNDKNRLYRSRSSIRRRRDNKRKLLQGKQK
jgi:hypothetical protein